jgi:glutathione S-transferase
MMLTLYGHPFSSYTWKALIPLYENETAFEFRAVGSDPVNDAFVEAAHPAGKFPVLVDKGTTIIEATAIVEHLAVHHSGKAPLIPADPAAAITTRMLDRVFDNYVMANVQRVVAAYIADRDTPSPAEVDGGKKGLARAYKWLESWFRENPVPSHVSLFTCAAAPSLFYADWVLPIASDYPQVRALRAELLALPAVARCIDEARPYRSYFPPGAPNRD